MYFLLCGVFFFPLILTFARTYAREFQLLLAGPKKVKTQIIKMAGHQSRYVASAACVPGRCGLTESARPAEMNPEFRRNLADPPPTRFLGLRGSLPHL